MVTSANPWYCAISAPENATSPFASASASSTIRTFIRCVGRWIPGVSRNAICPRGSFRMPTMRLRVVCGFDETIDERILREQFGY